MVTIKDSIVLPGLAYRSKSFRLHHEETHHTQYRECQNIRRIKDAVEHSVMGAINKFGDEVFTEDHYELSVRNLHTAVRELQRKKVWIKSNLDIQEFDSSKFHVTLEVWFNPEAKFTLRSRLA